MVYISPRQYWNFAATRLAKAKWKRVHFLVPNRYVGSAITRGYQISRQLNQLGIYSRVFELTYRPKRVKEIKDSIFIVVKAAFQNNGDILSVLKENGNILIWDPLDGLVDLREEPDVQLFDGVILSNTKCKEDTSSYFKKDCLFAAIYHHWDSRGVRNHAKDYRLVYFGDIGPENIPQEYINEIRELHIERCNDEKTFKDLLRNITNYNCHFSVRDEHLSGFKYKPAVKLSFASATNSNIILSRDLSNLELLDASYPYYTSGDLESVKKTVRYSKETYGTKVWQDALDMMGGVRERTSIQSVGKDYIRFLSRF